MARPLRVEFPGAIYHVNVRMLGNWKREANLLFEDDADRLRFLGRLGERVEQFKVRLYLVTLMANHFHLVVETPAGNLGRFMQSLSTAYTVYFNRRHRRHGHLLDGRYKAKLVEGDDHLLALSRYVHLNPVHTVVMRQKSWEERIQHLRQYQWSSYPGYIGLRKPFAFVDAGPFLAQMRCRPTELPTRYREYVETGLAGNDDEFRRALKESPLCIGGELFRRKVQERYDALGRKHRRPEDVSFRKVVRVLSPQEIMNILAEVFQVEVAEFGERRRDSPRRSVAARMLCGYGGLSQREAAEVLRMGSGSAVSRQIAHLADRLENDPRLRKLCSSAEAKLDALRNADSARS